MRKLRSFAFGFAIAVSVMAAVLLVIYCIVMFWLQFGIGEEAATALTILTIIGFLGGGMGVVTRE